MSERPYLQRVRIANYRVVQDCELKLTRLHALVGANDCGKSTLLRALGLAQRMFDVQQLLGPPPSTTAFELDWSDGLKARRSDDNFGHSVLDASLAGNVLTSGSAGRGHKELAPYRGDPRFVRFDAASLMQPCELIPSASGILFDDERGAGLAAVYDALLSRRRPAFDAIDRELGVLFPSIEALVLINVDRAHKQIAVRLKGASGPLPADQLSEGMLFFLAHAALPHLDSVPLLLIEQPENGLNPAAIGELARLLRRLSADTQVVLTTHSPVLLDELTSDEISLVTRDETGTHATLLSAVPGYAAKAGTLPPGQIWRTL